MSPLDGLAYVALALTFVLAGFVKGVVGMGLPTVAMGLMGAFLPPAVAASILVIPSLVTNLVQLFGGPAVGPLWRRLWPMMVAVLAGTWIGFRAVGMSDVGLARSALGVVLIAYGIYGLFARAMVLPRAHERAIGIGVGLVTGVITGITGIFVIPAVPFLQALGLSKEELVQALGLAFTVATVALGATLATAGVMTIGQAGVSLLALVPALGGMWLGQRLRRKISEATFRRAFFVGLIGLGGYLATAAMR